MTAKIEQFSTCEGCAQQKADVRFTDGVRDYLCPKCREGVCTEGEYVSEAASNGCVCTRCADARRPRLSEAMMEQMRRTKAFLKDAPPEVEVEDVDYGF